MVSFENLVIFWWSKNFFRSKICILIYFPWWLEFLYRIKFLYWQLSKFCIFGQKIANMRKLAKLNGSLCSPLAHFFNLSADEIFQTPICLIFTLFSNFKDIILSASFYLIQNCFHAQKCLYCIISTVYSPVVNKGRGSIYLVSSEIIFLHGNCPPRFLRYS